MNNANSGPYWFAAVVAGITAVTALLTGTLTTLLSNRQSNKRLTIELKHQRELERHKLLFGERARLYKNVTEQYQKVLRCVVEFEREPDPDTVGLKLANSVAEMHNLAMDCGIIGSKAVSKAALESAMRDQDLLTQIMNNRQKLDIAASSRNFTILLAAMRADLAAEEASGEEG